MSKYDYEDSPSPSKSAKLDIWNVLSIIILLFTCCIGVYFVAIYIAPQSPLNPFQVSLIDPNAPPTPTITPIQLEPTWTATVADFVTETPTLLPTFTLEPSPTLFSLVTPTDTPMPTATPKAPFSVNSGLYASTVTHPEAGCNWQGIGGTVVDANNADILRMTIRLVGTYNGRSKNELTVSSIAPAYGKSGFEFFLGTEPINSKGDLTVQLLDQAGLPLSDAFEIDLSKKCDENLVIVRFKKRP